MPTGTPTYIQVQANGTVLGIFPGGIQVTESSFTAGQIGPQASNAVSWLNNGTVIEQIFGTTYNIAPTIHDLIMVVSPDSTDQSKLTLESVALGSAGSSSAAITTVDHTGATATVTIIQSDGKSQFLRTLAPAATTMRWGEVGSGGAIVNAGSGDWTVVRNSAGVYTVTYNTAFVGKAMILAMPETANVFPFINANNFGSFQIVWRTPSLVNTDADFEFLALGV